MVDRVYTPPPTEHPADTLKRERIWGKCVCGHPCGNHIQPVNLSQFSVPKRTPPGGCLADLNNGICNCEQYVEAK